MSLVTKDVPAYMTVAGNPAWAVGLNLEGIKRRNISDEARGALKQAHRLVYRSGLKSSEALAQMSDLRESHSEVETFARSIEASDVELFAAVGVAHKLPGNEPILIGLLAGEPSGDILGAGLMQSLKSQLMPHTVRLSALAGR